MDGEREAKKLRSCDPDLKVVLGCDAETISCAATIEWHHSQNLASKSKYIDAMLSTPMKEKDAYYYYVIHCQYKHNLHNYLLMVKTDNKYRVHIFIM